MHLFENIYTFNSIKNLGAVDNKTGTNTTNKNQTLKLSIKYENKINNKTVTVKVKASSVSQAQSTPQLRVRQKDEKIKKTRQEELIQPGLLKIYCSNHIYYCTFCFNDVLFVL